MITSATVGLICGQLTNDGMITSSKSHLERDNKNQCISCLALCILQRSCVLSYQLLQTEQNLLRMSWLRVQSVSTVFQAMHCLDHPLYGVSSVVIGMDQRRTAWVSVQK